MDLEQLPETPLTHQELNAIKDYVNSTKELKQLRAETKKLREIQKNSKQILIKGKLQSTPIKLADTGHVLELKLKKRVKKVGQNEFKSIVEDTVNNTVSGEVSSKILNKIDKDIKEAEIVIEEKDLTMKKPRSGK